MQKIVLTKRQITPKLRRVLRLPNDAWQLMIDDEFTKASFMDAKCEVFQIKIDKLTQKDARRALGPISFR